jgi:adenylosuccinate synthase
MPVSVVVGGQFGSEGKGKVSLEIARRRRARGVVRVGGSNSGHTAVAQDGHVHALRQIPAAALAPDVLVILPPGNLIDIAVFQREVASLELTPDRVVVDPMATVITEEDALTEQNAGMASSLGSTQSGTGAALLRRISRQGDGFGVQASDYPELQAYLGDTSALMRRMLDAGQRIVVEGTQGFGLSVLHGGFYPKATSRDTTAAAFVGEAGLSPLDVDDVTMVVRTFPIRVAGNSGPLFGETTWARVAKQAGLPEDFCERTTVTGNIRRVGHFDPEIVRRAIAVNNPSQIVLNHVDYVDAEVREGHFTNFARNFVRNIEETIDRKLSWLGTGPASLVPRAALDTKKNSSRKLDQFEMLSPA